jgi:hypothetical protein
MPFPTTGLSDGQLYKTDTGVIYQYRSCGIDEPGQWVIVAKGIRGPFSMEYNETEDSLDFNYYEET